MNGVPAGKRVLSVDEIRNVRAADVRHTGAGIEGIVFVGNEIVHEPGVEVQVGELLQLDRFHGRQRRIELVPIPLRIPGRFREIQR